VSTLEKLDTGSSAKVKTKLACIPGSSIPTN
jgi:hypothetical protein